MAPCQGVSDEVQKAAFRKAGNHIEWHQGVAHADHIPVMSVEDAEIVGFAIIGCLCNFGEAQRVKPIVDLCLSDGDDIKAGLRGHDAQIPRLSDDSFESIQVGNELIVEIETFEVLEWRGFPAVKAAAILVGRNQCEINAGVQSEDPVLGELPLTVSRLFVPQVMLLPVFDSLGRQVVGT